MSWEAAGDAVDTSQIAVGDHVGVGAIAGSCMRCEFCLAGQPQFCALKHDTALRGHRGGFAHSERSSPCARWSPIS
ncbi:alcohol dehydrogenase catalytic domain-containing protein [Saccharopolyspora tripterygii]